MDGLAAHYDFNLLSSVKPQVHAMHKLSADLTSIGNDSGNSAPSWMAEVDDLSLQKQGSIESIISLPTSVALSNNVPFNNPSDL